MTIQPIDLAFTQPSVPLSMNKAKGIHWARLKAFLDPWKKAAWAVAHNHRVRSMRAQHQAVWRPKPITVQAVLQFHGTRGRDAHNYTGTVVKSMVDGLVQARIVPEDTPAWVTVLDPVLEVVPATQAPTCTIRIRPREVFTHGPK